MPHLRSCVKFTKAGNFVLTGIYVAEDQILVEFEHAIDYKSGDRIYLEGSLELKITEEM